MNSKEAIVAGLPQTTFLRKINSTNNPLDLLHCKGFSVEFIFCKKVVWGNQAMMASLEFI